MTRTMSEGTLEHLVVGASIAFAVNLLGNASGIIGSFDYDFSQGYHMLPPGEQVFADAIMNSLCGSVLAIGWGPKRSVLGNAYAGVVGFTGGLVAHIAYHYVFQGYSLF